MIPTFTIFLREGIEASIIVAILLAYLDKIDKREHFKDVILGVFSALLFATLAGTAIFLTVHKYAGTKFQDIFETITYLFATAVMTYMTFWMSSHAKGLSLALGTKADEALENKARFGLAAIAFQAVGRESLESVIFTLAIIFASSGHGVIIGGIGGLVVSLFIAFWIYRLGKKLNIRKAFKSMSIALMIFAGGLLADAIQNIQGLGWLPVLSQPLWNTSSILSQHGTLGDIVHMFLGYTDKPTVLQLIVYVSYLSISVYFFLSLPKRADQNRTKVSLGSR